MLFAISDTLVNALSNPIGGSFNLTLNQFKLKKKKKVKANIYVEVN